MTGLDSGGQKLRSQQAIEVAKTSMSMLVEVPHLDSKLAMRNGNDIKLLCWHVCVS